MTAPSFLFRSSSLRVTGTCIKFGTSSNSGLIHLLTLELLSLECQKKFRHDSPFIFDRIFIKLADNEDRDKILDEFDIRPDQTICFCVTRIEH